MAFALIFTLVSTKHLCYARMRKRSCRFRRFRRNVIFPWLWERLTRFRIPGLKGRVSHSLFDHEIRRTVGRNAMKSMHVVVECFSRQNILSDLNAWLGIGATWRAIDLSGVNGWLWSAMSPRRINIWANSSLLLTKKNIFWVSTVYRSTVHDQLP